MDIVPSTLYFLTFKKIQVLAGVPKAVPSGLKKREYPGAVNLSSCQQTNARDPETTIIRKSLAPGSGPAPTQGHASLQWFA